MTRTLRQRDDLTFDLGNAIARDALDLSLQPFFDLDSGDPRGFEALSRWTHPTHGLVPCEIFIPLAEASGLIGRLGSRVLERSCAIAQSWSEPLSIAVNVSPTQLLGSGFARRVADILSRTGLAPERLELEITENVLITNVDIAILRLAQLRRLGVRLAIDDFGTGFSSLRYLARLPVDKVKIDQSFVRAMPDDRACEAIISAVASLCRTLGVITTAEGVETPRQLEMLRRAGCDQVQGYLLGAPVPVATARPRERRFQPAAEACVAG